MAKTHKTRQLPFGGGGNKYTTVRRRRLRSSQQWQDLADLSGPSSLRRYAGSQITDSESHQWPPKGHSGDVGGPFSTVKRGGVKPSQQFSLNIEESIPTGSYDMQSIKHRSDVSTPIETNPDGTPKFPTLQTSSESTLNARGGTAVSRCRPTASGVELSTALAELRREGLPSLPGVQSWQERTRAAKNAGGEYLNVQFGWAPLVSEVTKLRDTVHKSGEILNQYRSDRGNLIRRSYSFPSEVTSSTVTLSTSKFPDGLDLYTTYPPRPSSGGTWSKTTTTTRRCWFKGAFVYGVPSSYGGGVMNTVAEADRLYGLSLTPDVLWNLTPWSWATDWFLNTGDVLETLSDFISQGLVMQYGYLMEHSLSEVTYSLTGAIVHGKSVSPPPARLYSESKVRVKANPFGFGVSYDGLSSSQQAILVALGLSRS